MESTPLKGKLKGKGKEKYSLVKKTLKDLSDQDKEQILKNSIKAISHYSIKNQLLILLQKNNITELKGYKGWKDEGLKPVPNSGIFIYQPIFDKKTDEIKGYFLGTVFDRSDCIPIPKK